MEEEFLQYRMSERTALQEKLLQQKKEVLF